MIPKSSYEYWDHHLTPKGWIQGSFKTSKEEVIKEVPGGTVLTLRETEVWTSKYDCDTHVRILFSVEEDREVQDLQHVFGITPVGVGNIPIR